MIVNPLILPTKLFQNEFGSIVFSRFQSLPAYHPQQTEKPNVVSWGKHTNMSCPYVVSLSSTPHLLYILSGDTFPIIIESILSLCIMELRFFVQPVNAVCRYWSNHDAASLVMGNAHFSTGDSVQSSMCSDHSFLRIDRIMKSTLTREFE